MFMISSFRHRLLHSLPLVCIVIIIVKADLQTAQENLSPAAAVLALSCLLFPWVGRPLLFPLKTKKERQNLHLFQLGSLLLGFCLGLLRLESASHPDNFFALKKKHEHRTFFCDTMGGRKKYIPLEITQKGSSFRVQSLSWTALLLCTLRFNNVIGAGAARFSYLVWPPLWRSTLIYGL